MTTTTRSSDFQSVGSADGWVEHHGSTYRFPVVVTPSDGRFVATSQTVPAVTATGGTESEALTNVTAALATAVIEAKAGRAAHPKSGETPRGTKWVFVKL